MIITNYSDLRNQLSTGDLIAFSGQDLTSTVVRLTTNSPVSHVGIILCTETSHKEFAIHQLIESTSLSSTHSGVAISRLSTRIASYTGTVWALPLAKEVRTYLNDARYLEFMLSQRGKPYDVPQAIASTFDGLFPDTPKDLSALFCSELVVAGLQAGGAIPSEINPSEMTPRDVVNLPIWKDCYHVHGPIQDIC